MAYEADDLDPQRQLGWSVVVTGLATTLTDPEQIARYERRLHPWVNAAMDTVIADRTADRHRHAHRWCVMRESAGRAFMCSVVLASLGRGGVHGQTNFSL